MTSYELEQFHKEYDQLNNQLYIDYNEFIDVLEMIQDAFNNYPIDI